MSHLSSMWDFLKNLSTSNWCNDVNEGGAVFQKKCEKNNVNASQYKNTSLFGQNVIYYTVDSLINGHAN